MKKPVAKLWKYGDAPPSNWADAATLLKVLSEAKKPKRTVIDRLDEIESQLEKEKT